MTDLLEMPSVHDCSATSCAYNHDGCHAFAVSIDFDAACATFLSLDDKGGLDVVAQVGACQRADCVNNESLECRGPVRERRLRRLGRGLAVVRRRLTH